MMMWECDEIRPAVESRSDIQNVWTLLLFFAPSCLAVAALVVQYLVLHTPLARSTAPWDVNPLDVVILQWWRTALGRLGLCSRHVDQVVEGSGWKSVFDQFLLSLCDIQAGLGVAVLGYGFASLPRGVTAYDWWTIVGLAWLAALTNIAVISCLRDLFRKYPAKRDWRLCWVFAMVAVLALCMVPIGRMKHVIAAAGEGEGGNRRDDVLAANALCFFPGRGHVYPSAELRQLLLGWAIVAALLAVVAALAVVVMILERRDGVLRRWRHRYRGETLESSTDGSLCARCEQRFILLVMRPFIAVWLTLRAHLDLLNSILTEITCVVALFVWVSLRFWQLLQLRPDQTLETTPTFAHFVALAILLAPFKPLVEHISMICRSRGGIASFGGLTWARKREYQELPAFKDPGKPKSEDTTRQSSIGDLAAKEQSASIRAQAHPRRKTPKHFKFYLETAWFVKALPIVCLSALAQLVFMFVLSTIGGKSGAEAVLLLAPWYVVFAPLSVLLYILVAMITEERGGSTEKQKTTYWCTTAALGPLSVAAAVDTVYGLGGYPISYLGMAAMGLMVVTYLLYGCISKPGHHVKGKGASYGGGGGESAVDEESALLGYSKVRIPVRRPKQLHGPSRRLGKQSMKSYGTMATKPGTK